MLLSSSRVIWKLQVRFRVQMMTACSTWDRTREEYLKRSLPSLFKSSTQQLSFILFFILFSHTRSSGRSFSQKFHNLQKPSRHTFYPSKWSRFPPLLPSLRWDPPSWLLLWHRPILLPVMLLPCLLRK